MSLSPRERADYLLLLREPTPRQCLSAFATESGVTWLSGFSNIVEKAGLEMPELATILENLPPTLVAAHVANFLDGGLAIQDPSTPGLTGDFFSETFD